MPTLSKPPRTNAGLNHPRQMLKSCLIPTRCTARTGTVMEVGYEVPELQDDCEMLWVKLRLQGRETFYICTTDRMLLVKLPCHGSTPLLLELQLSPTLMSSHLCQEPPDCSNPKQCLLFCLFLGVFFRTADPL